MYWRIMPTVYPRRVSVRAVIPFGWLSMKSWAMPAANPPEAPAVGPSSIASTIVIRYASSGLAPNSWIWLKMVVCRSSAVRITAAHESARRIPRV
jgi:hypothetical protein